ncbi:HCL136Wp [Eremothecium sinecaudum]|uniref:DNA polymerase n=1 Tax=Eremothecium sinecaudum TaxID=45286 RepID=A0A0X8HRC5_9SACH|nr:HCL136Wp [Eremothecium sinecaudum]AMD20015.1 HCL136Wp [Eremothecium sinecaudum]
MFKGRKFLIFPTSNTPRAQVVVSLIQREGGTVLPRMDGEDPNHVIPLVQDSYLTATGQLKNEELFKLEIENPVDWQKCSTPMQLSWVSKCLEKGELLDRQPYELGSNKLGPKYDNKDNDLSSSTKKRKFSAINDVSELKPATKTTEILPVTNELIVNALDFLGTKCKLRGDVYRQRAYNLAKTSVLETNKPIKTYEDARALPKIGDSIARKIADFVTNGGHMPGFDMTLSSSELGLQYFSECYSVGPRIAQNWQMQGYMTFQDVIQDNHRWKWHWSALWGMKYFEDWQIRMSRNEVEAHFNMLKSHAPEGVIIEVLGSYRRGHDTCGDIDVIFYRKNCDDMEVLGHDLETLLNRLSDSGYIRCPLQLSSTLEPIFSKRVKGLLKELGIVYTGGRLGEDRPMSKKFYCGVRLPDSTTVDPPNKGTVPEIPFKDEDRKLFSNTHKHHCRRLDILCCKWSERGSHRLYFTGNREFNKLVRTHATERNLSLNQHGLFVKDTDVCLESFDENKIIELVGVTPMSPSHPSRNK